MRLALSLQVRLMLLVGAAVAPLVGLSVWFGLSEMEVTTAVTRTQLQFAASLIAGHQERTAESARSLLKAIAEMPGMVAPKREVCEPYFRALRQQFPLYSNIGLIDLHGNVVCHANGAPGELNASDRGYFQRALQERRFIVGEMVSGRASGRVAIPFALPLMEGDHVTGVAFAAVDVFAAAAGLGNVLLPEGARVLVADRQARVLMDYPPRPGRAPGRLLVDSRIRELAAAMQGGGGELLDNLGVPRIYAAVPTRDLGGEQFFALVTLPRDEITSASWARLRHEMALMGVMLVAGLIAAWWVGARTVVKPAKQILGAVRRLEEGSLEARVPLLPRAAQTEFGRIGHAFNLMAQSLQIRQRDLEAELGRSRGAYSVLDTVLNGMQEGLVAVSRAGRVLLHNRAAALVLPLGEEPPPPQQQWPRAFGLYRPSGLQLYGADETPFARALRGESGEMLVLARNAQVPGGRLLRCAYQPLQSADDGATGGLVVFTDVTDLEKVESDLVLLRNAVARLNDIVLITEAEPLDMPGPRIVFVNEAFERLTGYCASEAIGNTPRMLQGPDTDRATLDRIRAALQARRPVREELLNYTKDGRPLWLELDIVPLADEGGRFTHLIAVQRDITARKDFEQALLASEGELQDYNRMLQRTAEAAQAITRQRGLDDTLQEVVDQAREVLGVRQAMLRLQPFGETLATAVASPAGAGLPEPSGEAGARMLAVNVVNSAGDKVGRLELSDPGVRDFSERDEYVAIELAQLASTAIENARLFEQIRQLNAGLEARIAERTAELTRQEKRFRALADQAPAIVWNADPRGRGTYLNRAWYELSGGEPPQWLGSDWLARIHPEDLEPMRERWVASRATLQPFAGVRRMLARDGSWHTMSYRAVPVLDDAGKVEFWVGVDSDITDLKAIEQALRDSNAELEAFSYSVSHDLRAPLGAIDGFSKALADKLDGPADERMRHYLSRIRAGVGKMEQLIGALLELSRVARAPLTVISVDLGTLAREAVEGLQMQEPLRRVALSVEEGLTAHGDASLLRVLMENLVGNAWKFTGRAEAATIEVGRDRASGAFFVRDNGVGFDMAYADKLFSAFQRLHTESEFPGTGIGLATVRRIVVRHHGRVWAESVAGAGTTFYFTLTADARTLG